MIHKQILKLRKEHQRAKSAHTGGRFRYPEKIKQLAVEILNSGVAISELAKHTGLNAPAILKWSRKISKTPGTPIKSQSFRKLSLTDATTDIVERFYIILPSGIRIECTAYHQLTSILGLVA
jgi:transposase-like protein